MNQDRLAELYARIGRIRKRLNINAGSGFSSSAEVEGGKQHYHILGIKNPVDRKDEILNLMVWVWSMKDHLIKKMEMSGIAKVQSKLAVEGEILRCFELQICMDVANSEKHSGLDRKSWSGLHPEIQAGGFVAPQESLRKITLDENGITLDVDKPELVRFPANVHDSQGCYLGDALEILDVAISRWESFIKKNIPE